MGVDKEEEMSRKTKGLLMVVGSVLVILAIFAIACTGPEGPAGPAGAAGPAGPAGPAGAAGAAAEGAVTAGASVGLKPDSAAERGKPGRFTLWGSGFQAGEAITLFMVGAIGGEDWIIGGAEANDSGAFYRTGVRVVSSALPPDLAQGVYTVKAVGAKGTVATCLFRVTPPPTPTPKPETTPTS